VDRICLGHNRRKWIWWRFHRYFDLLFISANLCFVFSPLSDGTHALWLTVFTTVYIGFVFAGQRMVALALKPHGTESADGGETHPPSTVGEPGRAIPTIAGITMGSPVMDTVNSQSLHLPSDSRRSVDTLVSDHLASASHAGFAVKVSVFLILTMVTMIIRLEFQPSEGNLVCYGVIAMLCIIGIYRIFHITASGTEIPFTWARSSFAYACQALQSSNPCVHRRLVGRRGNFFGRPQGDTKFSLRELIKRNMHSSFKTLLDSLSEDRVFIRFSGVSLLGELQATPREFAQRFGVDLAPHHNHWVCIHRSRKEDFLNYLEHLAECHRTWTQYKLRRRHTLVTTSAQELAAAVARHRQQAPGKLWWGRNMCRRQLIQRGWLSGSHRKELCERQLRFSRTCSLNGVDPQVGSRSWLRVHAQFAHCLPECFIGFLVCSGN